MRQSTILQSGGMGNPWNTFCNGAGWIEAIRNGYPIAVEHTIVRPQAQAFTSSVTPFT